MLTEVAKIFYLGGGSHARGMFRAVVPLNQLESVVPPELIRHLGDDFPEPYDTPITLLEISDEEAFDERLRFLLEPAASHMSMKATSKIPSSSALIHRLTRDLRTN